MGSGLPLPTAWLSHIQGNINWRVDKLTLGALIYRQLRTTAQIQNAKLKLDPLDAKIGEADVHLRMAYASSGDGNGARARCGPDYPGPRARPQVCTWLEQLAALRQLQNDGDLFSQHSAKVVKLLLRQLAVRDRSGGALVDELDYINPGSIGVDSL